MRDSWCRGVVSPNGNIVYGGAARNVRIAARGGMDNIVSDAVVWALDRAEAAVRDARLSKVRLVASR